MSKTKRDTITLTRREARDLIRAIEILSETAYRRGYQQGFELNQRYVSHRSRIGPLGLGDPLGLKIAAWRLSPIHRRETLPPMGGRQNGDPLVSAQLWHVTTRERLCFDSPRRVRMVDGEGLSSCKVIQDFIDQVEPREVTS